MFLRKTGLTLALALLCGPALAHEAHKGGAAEPAPAAAEGAAAQAPAVVPLPKPPAKKRDPRAYFTDRLMLDQNGKSVRFYSDVLKDRLVVINTAYTNCTDACPLITEQMVRVRKQLGEYFGKEIFFVTISSDPENDTPAAMKAFAQKNKADEPGWLWLTGNKNDVNHVLQKLGQWSQFIESHATHVIAWNFKTDRGRKMLPNIAPEALAAQIKLLLADDGTLLPGLPGAGG